MSTPPQGGGFLLEEVGFREIFIPEHLTDEQKQLTQAAHDFMEGEVLPKSEEIEKKNFEVIVGLVKKAGELGLLAAEIPEEYGGLGVDKVTTVAMGEASALQGSFTVTMSCHTGIATWPLMYFGTPEQKKKYLTKLGTGEMIGAYCLTEPGSGSDALGMRSKTVLSPDGKQWILNGEKTFITNGGFADLFTIFAKVDGEKVSAFLVERTAPGLSTGREEKKMGIHGSSTVPVIMENCKIPKENLLGEVGKGHKVAFNTLNLGRFKLGIGATGGSKFLIGRAIAYAKERKQFGRPICEFGLIQKKIANMTMRTYVSESMNYRTAAMMDEKIHAGGGLPIEVVEEFAVESTIAKIYGSECIELVCDEGLQTLGGYGFLEEYPFAATYRNIRINRLFEGTNEINRLLIPAMLFKKAMKGELPLLEAIQTVVGELKAGWQKKAAAPLSDETHMVELAKKLMIYTAGVAAQKYGEELREKQFIAEFMADMTIETYAMETSLLRAFRIRKDFGEEKGRLAHELVRLYVNERYPEMLLQARWMLLAVAEGNADESASYEKALKRFDYFVPVDTTTLRTSIARTMIERESYQIVR